VAVDIDLDLWDRIFAVNIRGFLLTSVSDLQS